MQKIQSASFHLYCLAGPDVGALLPLASQFSFLGRGSELSASADLCLTDPQTSRLHVLFEVRADGVWASDLGALNGMRYGRFFHPLPGFVKTWVFWKTPGSGSLDLGARPLNPGVCRLAPGDLLQVGANLWQLRTIGSEAVLGLDPAEPLRKVGHLGWQTGGRSGVANVFQKSSPTQAQPRSGAHPRQAVPSPSSSGAPRLRQLLFLVLPLISLTVLALRFLPATAVYYSLGALALVAGYFWLRRLQHAQLAASWEPAYTCHLPVKTAGKSGQFSLQLPAEVSGKPVLRWQRLQRFKLRPGLKVYCPPGTTLVTGPQAANWTLVLGLLTVLNLKVFGQHPQLEVTPGKVRVSTTDSQQQWVFQAAAGQESALETPVEMRLNLAAPAPLAGAALGQIRSFYPLTGARPQTLSLAQLRQLAKTCPPPPEPHGNLVVPGNLAVPVGLDAAGNPFYLDLVAAGPHGIIAGTSGSGKSVALRTWLQQLCHTFSAAELRLVLFDYKGGAALREFTAFPQVEGLVTDLEPQAAKRVLAALAAEVKLREMQLAERGFADISQWRQLSAPDCPPRILCVVDEYKVVSQTHPQDVQTLLDLCARGRSLGIHLLLATQSAAGVVTGQMRANLSLKISFRTATAADSLDLLGSAEALQLAGPGQALLVAGAGAAERVQWAYSEPAVGVAPAREPSLWQLPLAAQLPQLRAQYRQAAWVLDDFGKRCQRPVTWQGQPLAVVADEPVRAQILASLQAEKCLDLQRFAPQEWAVRLHNAGVCGQPVVISDLHQFVAQLDAQLGVGAGREVWERLSRSEQRVLVGVAPADFALTRLVPQVLVHCDVAVGKQLGLAASVLSLLADLEGAEFVPLRWPGLAAGQFLLGLGLHPFLPEGAANPDFSAGASLQLDFSRWRSGETVEFYVGAKQSEQAFAVGEQLVAAAAKRGVSGINLEVKMVGEVNRMRNVESVPVCTGRVQAYFGLSELEVKALQLPYFARNLPFYAGQVWVCSSGVWQRSSP